jgi:alanine-glyoxylate transaminase / serine-glyoxylate transaminase / serine-pyruvate transaminase
LTDYGRLDPAARVLLGPGPSCVHPRVYQALGAPIVGHLDPQFVSLMEEVKQLLRATFRTDNKMTLPISGTGSAGMEACLVNIIEPGDPVLVCVNGVFGERMSEVARRCGANVHRIQAEWGVPFGAEDVKAALAKAPFKAVCLVHAETSTGVLQPMEAIAQAVRQAGTLLVLDTVTSLGGVQVEVDQWGVDLCYSGTQKCLSCPPGLAPVTISDRALEVMAKRRSPVQSWYFDLSLLGKYWNEDRVYHHTAPISMNYALREALVLLHEEGLANAWERHRSHQQALVRGLSSLGLDPLVAEPHRLPSLTTVRVPDGIDEAAVRGTLLARYSMEIGVGLGAYAGKAWRVGLMGHSSRPANIALLLQALAEGLNAQGHVADAGRALQAAGLGRLAISS